MSEAGGQADVDFGWLQYRTSANQSVQSGLLAGGQTVILNFPTDTGSVPNSFFDKASDSQFRALMNLTAVVSFGATVGASINDVGFDLDMRLNGTVMPRARTSSSARSSANERKSVSKRYIVDMNTNDVLTMVLTATEGGLVTYTALANLTYVTVEFVRRR